MIRALEDEPLRAALKVKGFDRAKQFSWEQAATKTEAKKAAPKKEAKKAAPKKEAKKAAPKKEEAKK